MRSILLFCRLSWYQMVNLEHGKSFFGRKNCQNNLKNCQKRDSRKKSKPDIRCAVCSHKLVNEEKSEFLNDLVSPYAKSIHKLQLFGSDNVTIQEFVNPHNHHFHSVQVKVSQK
jgi:DNA-directed RNA polymerase subunit RPC12/RpoP